MNIFEYDDYRIFLTDFFNSKKELNNKFSLVYYSKLINRSDAYLKQVLSKRRTLNIDTAKILAKKIKLKPLESSYFLTLVIKEKSKTKDLSDYFESVLTTFRENLSDFNYVDINEGKGVFKNSLTWELYTFLKNKNFLNTPINDLATIACKKLTHPKAKEIEIKKAIQYLIDSKILKNENGYLTTPDIVIEHKSNDHDLRNIYITALDRAINYLQEQGRAEKNADESTDEYFDSFCLITGKNEFKKIVNLLEETKKKMATIVNTSKNKDVVCYYNSNIFRISKEL